MLMLIQCHLIKRESCYLRPLMKGRATDYFGVSEGDVDVAASTSVFLLGSDKDQCDFWPLVPS